MGSFIGLYSSPRSVRAKRSGSLLPGILAKHENRQRMLRKPSTPHQFVQSAHQCAPSPNSERRGELESPDGSPALATMRCPQHKTSLLLPSPNSERRAEDEDVSACADTWRNARETELQNPVSSPIENGMSWGITGIQDSVESGANSINVSAKIGLFDFCSPTPVCEVQSIL